jgi:quercetin dioxygenase-like cupin family protein
VIRLIIPSGGAVPEHSADADVIVVVTKGHGIFTLRSEEKAIVSGDIIEMKPNEPHAILAQENLELLVIQMKLDSSQQKTTCGT